MKLYAENIRSVSLFSTLSDQELEMVAKIAFVKTFNKGYMVFEEGEKRDTLYIVLKGRVKISLYDEDGREYILDIISKDGFFGELSLFEELSGFANVMTLEHCELLVIRRKDFMGILRDNNDFALSMIKELSKRLRAANEKLKRFAFLGVEGRILEYLMDIGQKSGIKVKDRIIIESGPTQVEIASACGCSRETVSRMIKSLVEKGRLSVLKKQYTIRPVYEPM
ncbi:MAG TPA: Crp/Fnr family transcriptional regulator [Syntrophorhabdus sp.]|jgi:CRP-like cAMP-binding protein|nr:MAG: cAMP-activated global transcriptional regulator CRP [Syntrophorhabdus sp. PtaB.Bin027]OQB76924.1 MAG: cAMP-activated global transcriptional regulator CRP [Deltaproteobacteria bacterium ADurb.Bin135]HNS79377.1 Crp/Fnr family transcriptional regulator [Syntrophorhabdus sp.]HOD79476.1 Crp/Fnr family transcriptional regulator [Syntrophorhabdus sp.]HQM25164.1 Crp/Fnr family transcriptional regulator [Syntrophorhabdus sp.]